MKCALPLQPPAASAARIDCMQRAAAAEAAAACRLRLDQCLQSHLFTSRLRPFCAAQGAAQSLQSNDRHRPSVHACIAGSRSLLTTRVNQLYSARQLI